MRFHIRGMRAALLVAFAAVILVSPASAQAPSYHVTILDPSSTEIAYPAAINSSGEIVGSVGGSTPYNRDAATWINGVFTDVTIADSLSGAVFSAVNSSGDTAGTYPGEGSNPSFSFADIDGIFTTIPWQGQGNQDGSGGVAINDSDEVVGVGYVANPPNADSQPFLWANGTLTSLGLPKGGIGGYPVAINNSGLIAGDVTIASNNPSGYTNNAFFYSNGQFTILPATIANVSGMNQAGAVTGNTLTSSNGGVPLVYANGVLTLYKLPKGAVTAGGTTIDSYNDIAGSFSDSVGAGHGMIAAFNQACYDLTSELDSSGAGLTISVITSMNDSGEMVGEAINNSTKKSTGVLLTLNGTPSTASLSPAYAPATTAINLAVAGTNFSPLSVIDWNGMPLATHLVSGTKLTATVPTTLNPTAPGDTYPITAQVTVTQLGGTTAPLTFLIMDPRPTLTTLTPATAAAGAPDTTITLAGKGFAEGAVANWNGTDLTITFVTNTKLTATVPAALLANPGTFYMFAINPLTGGGSNALPVVIVPTTLVIKAGTPTINTTNSTVKITVTVTDTGYSPAPSAELLTATLGGQGTTSALPASLSTIPVGKSGHTTLVFPLVSGATATLAVTGSYTGGTFKGTSSVKL